MSSHLPVIANLEHQKLPTMHLQVRIHPSSINNQLTVPEPAQGSSGECSIVLFEEITRGEAQLYVRQCTLAGAHALLLVAAHLGISQDEPSEQEGEYQCPIYLSE